MDFVVGMLAFRQKPEGGSDYIHTVAQVTAASQDEAASAALQEVRSRYRPADGWAKHEITITSLAATTQVYADVRSERLRQDQRYGGPLHDDTLSGTHWCDRLLLRVHKTQAAIEADSDIAYRRRMVQVAALAVAAVETFDRGAKLR